MARQVQAAHDRVLDDERRQKREQRAEARAQESRAVAASVRARKQRQRAKRQAASEARGGAPSSSTRLVRWVVKGIVLFVAWSVAIGLLAAASALVGAPFGVLFEVLAWGVFISPLLYWGFLIRRRLRRAGPQTSGTRPVFREGPSGAAEGQAGTPTTIRPAVGQADAPGDGR